MTPEQVGILVDTAIPVAAGIFVTLLAHRVVGAKPGENPKMDAWHDRFGKWMKIVGPALVVISLITGVASALR